MTRGTHPCGRAPLVISVGYYKSMLANKALCRPPLSVRRQRLVPCPYYTREKSAPSSGLTKVNQLFGEQQRRYFRRKKRRLLCRAAPQRRFFPRVRAERRHFCSDFSVSAMETPALVPMRSAPASIISRRFSAVRMPPDAFTPQAPFTVSLSRRTSSAFAPSPK